MKITTRYVPAILLTCLSFVNLMPAAQEPPSGGFVIKPEIWQEFLGEYSYEGKQYVSVFRFSQQAEDGSPFFFDSKTGRTGPLEAVSETEFVAGGAGVEGGGPAVEARIVFLRNDAGEVDGLMLKGGGRPDIEAVKAPGME